MIDEVVGKVGSALTYFNDKLEKSRAYIGRAVKGPLPAVMTKALLDEFWGDPRLFYWRIDPIDLVSWEKTAVLRLLSATASASVNAAITEWMPGVSEGSTRDRIAFNSYWYGDRSGVNLFVPSQARFAKAGYICVDGIWVQKAHFEEIKGLKGGVMASSFEKVKSAIAQYASLTGFKLGDAAIIAYIESQFVPTAVSPSGNHFGLFQLQGNWFDRFGFSRVKKFDPVVNAQCAAKLMCAIQDNISPWLKDLGVPATPDLLYAAHNLGEPMFKLAFRCFKEGKPLPDTDLGRQTARAIAAQSSFTRGNSSPATYFTGLAEKWDSTGELLRSKIS